MKAALSFVCFYLCSVSIVCAEETISQSAGELFARINAVHERFDKIIEPAFTDEFILADVMLDPGYPRRFDEFSGDISGRFLGALSMMSRGAEDDARLHRLMGKLLPYQREDGRFGNASLSFAAQDVGPEQMALLWGNGRLLVGLLEYYQRFPEEKAVLESAVRLGDFLLAVYDSCKQPEVMERVRGKAANGFICFTQFNEGLELLARATGNQQYRDVAQTLEPLLEPRGDQHTHGYLTTLRGHLMIYETTRDAKLLEAVERRYQDMVDSGSILINGGLLEYFKPGYDRDEGCSEADFLRLLLHLWRLTGKEMYLEQAERCLHNVFYANQYETGDFGHHGYDSRGYIPLAGAGRAWWCCTMHGMRAFRDVLDAVVTVAADKDGQPAAVQVNLWEEGLYGNTANAIHIKCLGMPEGTTQLRYAISVEDAADQGVVLTLRKPGWVSSLQTARIVEKKREAITVQETADNVTLPVLKPGETVEVLLDCVLSLVTRNGQHITLDALNTGKAEEYALFFGPWLMGVDSYWNPMFHGEPYGGNELLLPGKDSIGAAISFDKNPGVPLLNLPILTITYRHEGFPDLCKAALHPICDKTTHAQSTVSFWHRIRRATQG